MQGISFTQYRLCYHKYIISNEHSVNDQDVTSSYSVNELVQKEASKLLDGEKEFSSLIYMTKRINKETKNEYIDKFMNQISEPVDHTKNKWLEEQKYSYNSVDEGIKALKESDPKSQKSDTECTFGSKEPQIGMLYTNFEMCDKSTLSGGIIAQIGKLITNDDNGAVVDENHNLSLYFDLEDEKSREFMIALSEVTLPEIYSLKIENFYESDEDLEKFLGKSLRYVSNFVFISESFGVDIHDYLTFILKISGLNNLYLKGFMIDNDDCKKIFSSTSIQGVTFESGNLGIEDDFNIRIKPVVGKSDKSILSKFTLIDNEMDMETMRIILNSIKKSPIKDTFRSIELVNGEELSKSDVQNVGERLSLNIIVQ